MTSSSNSHEKQPEGEAALPAPAVLFFDGVCGMCNRLIDFVAIRDKAGRISFAPIQGETARTVLSLEEIKSLNTVCFKDSNGNLSRRSSAIVRVLWTLGGKWKFLGTMMWLFPKPLRDLFYWIVAKNRYRFFGKRDFCRLPTPEEQARFLS
jgi:predicted DCC family thiol-disulfide oxidoreductase YuxK